METAVIAARIAQFTAAAILFGAPLFLLYGLRPSARTGLNWPRAAAVAASLVLLVGAVLTLLLQTASMAGDPSAAFDGDVLAMVVAETAFGLALAARVFAAAATLVLALVLRPGRPLWLALAGLGAVALASFAWTGHGAATEGPSGGLHLASDLLHLLAAGVWLGALAALALMLSPQRTPRDPDALHALHGALAGFSGIGSAVVAVLLATGLVNSWFLVGPAGISRMGASPYGLLLIAKLVLFLAMLGLAAANRFRHTPTLAAALAGDAPGPALAALRRSVLMESAAGFGVLVLVSILGRLAPVAAQ